MFYGYSSPFVGRSLPDLSADFDLILLIEQKTKNNFRTVGTRNNQCHMETSSQEQNMTTGGDGTPTTWAATDLAVAFPSYRNKVYKICSG